MIRVTGTGEPAAFELSDPFGFINHLYTQPDHRSKGLGSAIEKQICAKLIRKEIVPTKDVEVDNLPVVKSSNKSPYWTRKADSNGDPITTMFLKGIRKEL